MFKILTLVVSIMFSGCSGILIHQAMQQKDLSPEQIEAYSKVGHKVFSCFQIAGPPPNGASSAVVIPQSSGQQVRFGPQCQIQM